jgi:GNAT superfamily N-acetyltransferase
MEAQLTIRPARPDDRAAMEHICAHTWEDGDYIPRVWDEWLADPKGALLVGELGAPEGKVVALSKITFQPAGQVWLEGMRVDPDYRGQGIGSRFLHFSLEYAREHGARIVRLATGGYNTPVHHITGHAGMEHIATYVLWLAESLPGGPPLTFLTPEHAAQVRELLQNSPVLAHTHGLYTVDWACQELSAALAAQLLDNHQVVAEFAPAGQLSALAILHAERGDDEMWIGFADGQQPALVDLLTAIRGYAATDGVERVRTMLPDLAWLREAFRAAGFGFGDWEGELWILESRLAQSPGLGQSQHQNHHDR